jgi:hypothetical protein
MNRADRRIATGKNKRFNDGSNAPMRSWRNPYSKEQRAAALAMQLKQEEINHGV